jgi:hypothetical protein
MTVHYPPVRRISRLDRLGLVWLFLVFLVFTALCGGKIWDEGFFETVAVLGSVPWMVLRVMSWAIA